VLIVEFAAQIATLGLKRGLAQQLASTDKPHVCVVWDALLVAFHRRELWRAIASGGALAYGRRPWLGLRFHTLFRLP